MPVLERAELEASPLADLHAIADQLGLDGFRRLRKADLIDAILAGGEREHAEDDAAASKGTRGDGAQEEQDSRPDLAPAKVRTSRSPIGRLRRSARRPAQEDETSQDAAGKDDLAPSRTTPDVGASPDRTAGRESEGKAEPRRDRKAEPGAQTAEGVVDVLGNGSAFLRIAPPEPSDQDVYISAAQVRRCELVSGDRVSGPVRTPRRSERYPSMVRIDTINGMPADAVSDGARYEDLPVAYPSQRLALGSEDRTLEAIEWLTPLGRGSRAVIVGPARAGKTETLRRLLDVVSGRGELEVTLVLTGARPEEIAQWQEGPVPPAAALSFATSADSQGQAVERAIESAKRVAARGGDALVLIDSLDGLHPPAARRALAAARNLREAGSLTVIATASRPFGGETTVIALDAALTSTGRQPILDLVNSGTLKPELLVGEDGAQAITQARLEAAG